MAALPLPVAILDDLISGSCKWGHPRWRPEAEGPPFSTSTSLGIEKSTPSPGWCHFRRRHLESKMATAAMTSGGRRDAREDVLQTSAPSMSPVEVWLYWKHLIVSLTQALSKWLSELPACHYAEVISLHMSKVVKNLRLQQAPTLLFFNCTLQFSRIIVQYSVIVGRNLETNLTPTMTIFWFSSILSTKWPWRSSTRTRSVW